MHVVGPRNWVSSLSPLAAIRGEQPLEIQVTDFYEVVPRGSSGPAPGADPAAPRVPVFGLPP
jgi:hypothetical protein